MGKLRGLKTALLLLCRSAAQACGFRHIAFYQIHSKYTKKLFLLTVLHFYHPQNPSKSLYSPRGAGLADRRVTFGTSKFYQIHTFFINKLGRELFCIQATRRGSPGRPGGPRRAKNNTIFHSRFSLNSLSVRVLYTAAVQ